MMIGRLVPHRLQGIRDARGVDHPAEPTAHDVVATDVDGHKGHVAEMRPQEGFGVTELVAGGVVVAEAPVDRPGGRVAPAPEVLGREPRDLVADLGIEVVDVPVAGGGAAAGREGVR
jgi:hypothetical protein